MPLTKVQFAPGIHKEGTQYTTGPSWHDGDKVRFRKGRPEQIGGWQTVNLKVIFPVNESGGQETTSFRGVSRSLLDWGTSAATKYLSIATNLKVYVEIGNTVSDITPLRLTTVPGEITFDADAGSGTIVVTHSGHLATAGDYVTYSGATSLGGNITADILNHEYEVDAILTGNTYEITARDVAQNPIIANSSDTLDGGNGIVGEYQITTGTNAYIPSTGFGVDTWGANPWGGGGAITFANQLRQYSQDVFGDDLIFNPRAGGVFYWDESEGTNNRAVSLTEMPGASNAPIAALQIMVSPIDRHVIAFGCNALGVEDGSLDPLLIRWSDQESAIDWTPTVTNSAGGQVMATGSSIIGAIKTRQEILVFTDTSITAMRFSGAPFIFQFAPVGENVTIVSPRAAISAADSVFFMDLEGFYVYRGSVNRLPCTVLNYVFSNINKTQLHKVYAANNPDDNEVTWFYPAEGEPDVSHYVTYNYMDQHWTIGTMPRGAYIQAPTKTNPLAASNDTVNVKTNYLYEQEVGHDADGQNMGAYLESGDMEIGDGESFIFMSRFIPDFRYEIPDGGSLNNVNITVSMLGRDFPLDDFEVKTTSTVLHNTKQKHVRVRAREIAMRIAPNGTGYGWTMGDFRFQMRTAGKR